MRDDLPDYDEIAKALDDYHSPHIKPLYMLIKVDVDADIVYDQAQAEKYAENHCHNMYYALTDWYYPDEDQFPYIAK